MSARIPSAGLGLLLFVLAAGVIRSQVASPKPTIDPEAETVLRQMSDYLKTLPSATFHLTDTIDDVQPDGRKLQFAHVREFTVVRPDKLKVVTSGDVTNRTVWKDGKTLTVLDRDKNVYAQLPDPGPIDRTLDTLQEKYGMSLPGADLLSADAYQTMTENCHAINYIGLGYVGEEKCHHLAFVRDNIDWQLWISAGEKPVPRKMVITYKRLPGEPQYTMQILKAEEAGQTGDGPFTCEIPRGAEKIEFQPARREAPSEGTASAKPAIQEKEPMK